MAEVTTAPTPRLKRVAAPVLLALAVGSVAAAFLLPTPNRTRRQPDPTAQAVPPTPVPAFAFTERSGQPVSNTDLLGKVWVASFIFTRCSGPCPSVSGTVARLQDELKLADNPDLRLVSFTFDPDNDTPGELRQYADRFRAHPDRWLFLTGPEDQLHALAKTGFKIGVTRNDDPTAKAGEKYQHTTYLAVVDRAGNIRGHFHGYSGPTDANGERFAEQFARLKATVAECLAESP
jgi:cytochrome oxidase Cu insertion factor (SCO1/SenC/PrrC family)